MTAWKSEENPMFRFPFAQSIFDQKYKHEGCETWEQLVTTLGHEVCDGLMPPDAVERLIEHMVAMRFIPGGRYLYYAGRSNPFYNNPVSGETQILTSEGLVCIEDVVDTEVLVFSPVSKMFVPAEINCFGAQPLNKITFKQEGTSHRLRRTVRATPEHGWILKDGTRVSQLNIGDKVALSGDLSLGRSGPDFNQGFAHGAVFADGNQRKLKYSFGHQLRLCGQKVKHLPTLEDQALSVKYPPFANGEPCLYFSSEYNLKELPNWGKHSPAYIAGFLEGYLVFDGSSVACGNTQIHSINREAVQFVGDYANLIGLIPVEEIKTTTGTTNYTNGQPRKPLFSLKLRPMADFGSYEVESIEPDGGGLVYCATENEHHQFTLSYGMATGNCYLLRAEEDTREDWANLSWKSESCLMTGGGIGVDYSVYRHEGAPIKRTGGLASGPLPKMEMINEIGRRVMQGGSRRSAIYGSLNWQHQDAEGLLYLKNWDEIIVPGTGKSLAQVKELDFNWPAPLDMTNISLNYDDALLKQVATGTLPKVFVDNVRQAIKTAEPGFSFNFGDKENETLRNACCEVTSEDDSDVCNLGSLNLSRIEDVAQMMEITALASQFLLCGTLRAKMPYAKVEETRDKNRRLGLGLMGVHEWLIQRGYKYEVTSELRNWLAVYQQGSEFYANDLADRLGVSRPVAYRAIAPTGTIGILAGTTTGIEPLFAVAYKRRYLKDGTNWHYEYVVDGTASELINRYDADPDKIESAIDLAADYERRIAFQADVQDFVDMAISSTINLPEWGSDLNNEDTVEGFAKTLARYAPRLRGFTCYPDGARGGQPLTAVPYKEAIKLAGQVFQETHTAFHDICDISGKGGSCGV